MPARGQHRKQTQRRLDVIKVHIEDVNLTAPTGPMAQGRDRLQWGLFDIDLGQATGGQFPLPVVGEIWWIKRGGRAWVLDRKVDPTRTDSQETGGGSGDGDPDRPGVPANVDLFFEVREKKKELEYHAAVTFDAVTTDENGDDQETDYYVIDWVPCNKNGNIIAQERVRQHIWNANDADPLIDDPSDPAAEYYVVLPGNVPRPKLWYWKGRVRAVSGTGHKGPWSDWCDPSLPIRDSLPEPPAPDNVDLIFKWKDTNTQPIFSAVVRFDDVNYWDIPGFDYEDDVSEYEIQLEPLERNDATGTIGPISGHSYDRADPNNDGTPWEIRRAKVKDKDSDDTYVTLGTLAQSVTETETVFNVDETGVDGTPTAPFIVQTNTDERWLVTGRTLVAGNVYEYTLYRQFNNTDFETHSNAEPLTWLKDPFRYKVDFHHIERPRTVYWRTRVRSKDRFNRLGPWSDYTDPETPWSNIDFNVPVPEDLRADVEIHSYKTHPVLKLIARFKDPAPNGWNIPGGDLQDDLNHYAVVAEALLPDPDGYIEGRDGNFYRIPDRRVGVLAEDVDPAETSIDIDFDDDLPNSIQRILTDTDKGRYYLRIETGAPEDPSIEGSEVVAVTGGTVDLAGLDTVDVERAQKGSGDYGHNTGNVVYLLTEHFKRATVHDKDEDDPGHFNNRYTVDLGRVSQGTRIYWRLRARSVDTFGHKSLWTEWTNPILPSADPDLILPYPSDISLDFDRAHKSHEVRWRAIVQWRESEYTAPDGDREVDVTRYGIQLATSDGDSLNLGVDSSTTQLIVDEKRTGGQAPGNLPFNILVDDEVMTVIDRAQANFVNTITDGDQFLGEDWDELTIQSNETIDFTNYAWAPNQYVYVVVRGQRNTDPDIHSANAHVFNLPFQHHTQSARSDDDPGNYNHSVFTRAHKYYFYKARARVYDRYNRVSEWSPWTLEGTPSDLDAPPPPKFVTIDVDNHKVVTIWDIDTDPNDDDSDANGKIPGSEVAYFQIQLSTHADFGPLLRNDRFVRALSKTWRIKKPGNGTYYVRVRSVDGSGNKSHWVSDSGAQNGVPTPDAPVIVIDRAEETQKLRALVTLETGVTALDDDVDGYEFELQPAEFKRLAHGIRKAADHIEVNNSNSIPAEPFEAYLHKEMVLVTSVNTGNDRWAVTRAYSGTFADKYVSRTKVQFFRAATKKRRKKTGEESEVDDPILAIYNGIQPHLWYRARVRAHNTKGRWGDWSDWS